MLRLVGCFQIDRAGLEWCPSGIDLQECSVAVCHERLVDAGLEFDGGGLELGHPIAAEGLRVCEELRHILAAAGGHVVQVARVAGEQFGCLVVNLALGAAEERLSLIHI